MPTPRPQTGPARRTGPTNRRACERTRRHRARTKTLLLFFLLGAADLIAACQPLTTHFTVSKPGPATPPEYPLEFTEGPKKGKDLVVAVFVFVDPGLPPECAGCEQRIESQICAKLPELARAGSQHLAPVEQARVDKYREKSQFWYYRHPREWGRKLDADYVLRVNVTQLLVLKSASAGRGLEGHVEATVDIYDVDAGPIKPKYHYTVQVDRPRAGEGPEPFDRFKQNLLDQLALELCQKHLIRRSS